jgi:hypothetical protein|tara:strand:+ start:23 stop:1618 length:1596 start_codon:yes stop_codon:yes gene_type:complete
MATNKAKELLDRYGKLKVMRGTWESHWQEIGDYVLPRRADVTKKQAKGSKRTELVYDGTAIHAAELLASSLHGMLTNAASPWFSLQFKDPMLQGDDAINEWLEECTRQMYQAFNRSNFQQEIHEMYLDLIAFGTGCMFVERSDQEQLRFSTRHISEIFIQENERGVVDTVFRKFKMSARAAFNMFGAATQEIKKISEENPYQELEFLHCVMPRDKRDVKKIDDVNKPFSSIYLTIDGKMLGEGGFNEFPYVVPRFVKSSVEVYGRSPSMTALPDIKMLNKMSETMIRAAQKTIDPPLLVPDDGFIMPIKTIPGGLNFYRSGSRDRIEPLNIGANFPFGLEYENQRREAIRQAYFVDQLLMAQNVTMTATEVLQRNEEKMRLLAPVLGRLQSEMLQPLIDRTFSILLRDGILPSPPPTLQGLDIDIEYVSPLARAQRQGDVNAMMRALEIIMPLNQVAPMLDYVDTDNLVKHIAEILGVPSKVIRSDGEVQELRNQRAQQQQAAAQAEAARADAQAAGQAAPMVKAVGGLGG